MKRLQQALTKAAADTASHMQSEIRQSALAHGWDPKVVANTHVIYDGKKFDVKVHPDYEEAAHRHEYGTEDSRPTAVLRKYNNNSGTAEKALTANIFKHLGGKL